jgi:hypothetical protein
LAIRRGQVERSPANLNPASKKEKKHMKLLRKTGFLSIALVLSLIGCDYEANPTIFVNNEKASVTQTTSLFLVPVRREYLITDPFAKTEEHLSAFLVYINGNTRKVSLSETEITLEENRLVGEIPYYFESAGEKVVAATYGDLSAQYTIIVRSSADDPGLITPQGGTSIGIEIIWK